MNARTANGGRFARFTAAGPLYWGRAVTLDLWIALLLPLWYHPVAALWHFGLPPQLNVFARAVLIAGQYFIGIAIVAGRLFGFRWLSFAALCVFMVILRVVVFDLYVAHLLAAFCLAATPVFFDEAVTDDPPGAPAQIHRSRVLIDFALAVAYTAAGISKLLVVGTWLDPATLGDHLLRVVLLQSPPWPALTGALLSHPAALRAIAVTTLLLECSGFLLPLLRRRWRCTLRLAFLTLHIGIGAAMGLPFVMLWTLIGWATWADLHIGRLERRGEFAAPFAR